MFYFMFRIITTRGLRTHFVLITTILTRQTLVKIRPKLSGQNDTLQLKEKSVEKTLKTARDVFQTIFTFRHICERYQSTKDVHRVSFSYHGNF